MAGDRSTLRSDGSLHLVEFILQAANVGAKSGEILGQRRVPAGLSKAIHCLQEYRLLVGECRGMHGTDRIILLKPLEHGIDQVQSLLQSRALINTVGQDDALLDHGIGSRRNQ